MEEEDLYNWMRRQQQTDKDRDKTASLEAKMRPSEGGTEKSVHIQIEEGVKTGKHDQSVIRQVFEGLLHLHFLQMFPFKSL